METNTSMTLEQSKPLPRSRPRARLDWIAIPLLALILILAAFYRFTGMNWDDYTHLHPDERFLTMVETTLELPGSDIAAPPPPGCAQWGGYFNTRCSPLNPYNHDFGTFVYGTFPIFLTRIAGQMVDQTGYDQIHLVGRFLSALFDLSTVLLIFFIGRRLYDWRAGLLGALFLAASVLNIQQAHFFTVDSFTNVPILIAFWYSLDIADGKKWPAFVFAGAAFGLALAGRINIAPFVAVIVLASALRSYLQIEATKRSAQSLEPDPLAEAPETLAQSSAPAVQEPRRIVEHSVGPLAVSVAWRGSMVRKQSRRDPVVEISTRAFVGLTVAGIITIVAFRVFQPYAANGPGFISPSLPKLGLSKGPANLLFDVVLSWAGGENPQFADNMTYVSDLVNGKIDYPPGDQWTNRTPYVFPFDNMVLYGLGLPLGLAGWAGFLLALYELVRYRHWEHLLVVAWVGITFGYSGQQFVKTMRYFLQIYPFLALLAGWFLVQVWDWARRNISRWRSLLTAAAVGLGIIVVGYTLFYATAFMSIYTHPYTRVAASDWIYANIPPGSVIANEQWDDPLPVSRNGRIPFPSIPGGPGATYRSLASSSDGEMHWYDEDTPDKRVQAIRWLDDAQYIVLSSNRLYGSIPRLPMRYPMTTKYYQWLFDGTLGFDRIATFTSRPQLAGIQINDDNAEEAFTVYDHPKVIIFKKSPRYSHANTVALFDSVDLSEVYRFTPLQATQAKTALLLTPNQWTAQMQGGTWSQIFDPGDWINKIPVVGWLAMIEIFGWLAFPLAFVVFRRLADRGYIFSKALGILIPSWGAWMLASLHWVPFSRYGIALVLFFVVLLAALLLRLRARQILAFFRSQGKIILVEEALFLGFFGLSLAIRYGNPDLWHPWYGGEKPMDFAFLNAVIKSTWFPPYDPWFAGGYINYYYFGQLITATLVRFSGIVPEVAYNLALPMYFALTAMGAFAVVFNMIAHVSPRVDGRAANDSALAEGIESGLANSSRAQTTGIGRALLIGLLAACLVAVIGNLGELALIAQTFVKIGGSSAQGGLAALAQAGLGIYRVFVEHQPFDIPIGWWYWNASRVIPDTINEFPFFTFLYADLHAHLMGLPFTLLALGLAVNFVLSGRDADGGPRLFTASGISVGLLDVLEVVIAGLVLGALRAINYADYPTYTLVIISAVAIGEYARRARIDLVAIAQFIWRVAAIIVLSTILFQPFLSDFATAYLSAELWTGARTTLTDYLTVHGIFLFVIATWLIYQTLDTKASRGSLRFARLILRHNGRLDHLLDLHHALAGGPTLYGDLVAFVAVGTFLLEVVLLVLHSFVFALAFPLLALAGLLVLRPDLAPERRFVALLIAAGLAMTIMVELITYKGDIGRMNTVFKFYLQVWVFFGVAAAAGLAFMLESPASSARSTAPEALALVRPARSFTTGLPTFWWGMFGVLLFAGMLYPLLATRAKVNDRFVPGSPPGLNGMDYMKNAIYTDNNREMPLVYDQEAIEWLRENIQGSPVILEGNAPLYHWGNRISIYTGLPAVIGWDWHEKQQRSIIDGAIIDNRIADVRTMYNTTDIAQALQMMARFHVSYIIVGDLERAFYDANGLAKFDVMARDGQVQLVYENQDVRIYKVIS